jgi:hypothetical protein
LKMLWSAKGVSKGEAAHRCVQRRRETGVLSKLEDQRSRSASTVAEEQRNRGATKGV